MKYEHFFNNDKTKELYKLLIHVSCLDKCNIYTDVLGIVTIGASFIFDGRNALFRLPLISNYKLSVSR